MIDIVEKILQIEIGTTPYDSLIMIMCMYLGVVMITTTVNFLIYLIRGKG